LLPGSPPGNAVVNPALAGGSNVTNGDNLLAAGQLGANGGGNLVVVAPPLTTNLGPPSFSSGAPVVVVQPQAPTQSPATLSPEALPLNSTAPMAILDPANYLLARGLNPSLNAGSLPSLLVTQTTETVLGAGANSGGGGNNTLDGGGGSAPLDLIPLPDDQEQMQQQVQEAVRFLPLARPAYDTDATADPGPAAPDGAVPLGDPQAALPAEAPAAATSADGDW
jgi:hypothetical protein